MDKYYKILGLKYPSSLEEVKRRFHKLAHIHHPDKGGDEATFKIINNAYHALSHPKYWMTIAVKHEREEKVAYRPKIFVSDDMTTFWVEDVMGFVIESWTTNPHSTDGISWKDLDDSIDFKDYTSYITSGAKKLS